MTIKVAVVGATGKLGQLVAHVIEDSEDFELFAGLGSQSPLSEMVGADIVVDVTLPHVSPTVVDYAIEHGMSVLVGTSGWSSEQIRELEAKIGSDSPIGVVIISNFSLGSVLATIFATLASRFFDSVEIIEAHHSTKVDAPSGTAVRTAELIHDARSGLPQLEPPGMTSPARGAVVAGIPIHSLRMRGVVSRQDVIFGGNSEMLTVSHETVAHGAYEAGVLLALRALGGQRGVVVGLDKLIELDLGTALSEGGPPA